MPITLIKKCINIIEIFISYGVFQWLRLLKNIYFPQNHKIGKLLQWWWGYVKMPLSLWCIRSLSYHIIYPKKYAHGFAVLCFVVVMQSFIMNSHEVFIHIHQGCFAGTRAIVRLPQCQWSKPGGYGKISQCITTTKHSKAKTVCIFLGIYCIFRLLKQVRENINICS